MTGVVTDRYGAVIPGVFVVLLNETTKKNVFLTTSPEGEYRFSSIEPGRYSLTFESSGFRKFVISDLDLRAAEKLKRDVTLELGDIVSELVLVERPLEVEKIEFDGKLKEPSVDPSVVITESAKKQKTKKSFASILWSPILKLFKRHETKSTPR